MLQAPAIGGVTFGTKFSHSGRPSWGRESNRHRETEGGARVRGILMAPASQMWS